MALIKPYKQFNPVIADDAWLAENASIIGDVEIGSKSSVWYQAVLRGDVGKITIGKESNIQDGAILHTTTHLSTCTVGDRVVVGHRAILHGCKVEDEVLIGMGAIILDLAVVPRHTIVGAGALVTERKQLESGFLYAGVPAKKIKPLSDRQIQMISIGALHYVDVMGHH
ncbi:MAG: gamma carbonic anhydrase family protein [Bacteroidia bacterium]|nr:gamma carbonic anhydrase family protein [Bacteroidia bacterium]